MNENPRKNEPLKYFSNSVNNLIKTMNKLPKFSNNGNSEDFQYIFKIFEAEKNNIENFLEKYSNKYTLESIFNNFFKKISI